jgi:enolase
MSKILSIQALEILDSRGQPTVRAFVKTSSGFLGAANVPSGASTGSFEALELRDGDPSRFLGKSVSKAVENVNGPISRSLIGFEVDDQFAIDKAMIDLDGTAGKSRMGANAILAVSMACARAAAAEKAQPLYRYLAPHQTGPWLMPCPMLNILNGGAHADNSVDFQEFMIRPIGASSFSEGLRWSCEVYATLKKLLKARGLSTGVGDEGGFAPQLSQDEQALELILEAIHKAGYEPGIHFTLALDCAASELYEKGRYIEKKRMSSGGISRSTQEQIELLSDWQKRYPIDSIEDGLAEQDWEGWSKLEAKLGKLCQIVGDDIFVTNSQFLQKGIDLKAAGAILIKLNQIGTVSETLDTIALAHRNGFKTIISHRSGETEDAFIADLALAVGSGQIKTGAPCRSDRVAKYNRLLEIELELGPEAHYAPMTWMPRL